MENFDAIATDPAIRRLAVEQHVRQLRPGEFFLNRYWLSATSGTSGLRGFFLHDNSEWASVIASYARATHWARSDYSLLKRTKMAIVSSTVPWHQSARVGESVRSVWMPTLRLDARDPLPRLVSQLNTFQPQLLVAYANLAKVLALEQLAGRLKIAPQAVFCASEVLTGEGRLRIQQAWGKEPFDVYGASEAAGIASECHVHAGMHLYEDLVVCEVVDENHQPVPPGVSGAKLLVSVLFSRTFPLIRYELDDRLVLRPESETCPCGLNFRKVASIHGRATDVIRIWRSQTDHELVSVDPVFFHAALEPQPVTAWRVVQQSPRALELQVSEPQKDFSVALLREKVTNGLNAFGVSDCQVEIRIVPELEKTQLGKTKLIQALSKDEVTAPTTPA